MSDKTLVEIATSLTVAAVQSGKIDVTVENVCDYFDKVFRRLFLSIDIPQEAKVNLFKPFLTDEKEKEKSRELRNIKN